MQTSNHALYLTRMNTRGDWVLIEPIVQRNGLLETRLPALTEGTFSVIRQEVCPALVFRSQRLDPNSEAQLNYELPQQRQAVAKFPSAVLTEAAAFGAGLLEEDEEAHGNDAMLQAHVLSRETILERLRSSIGQSEFDRKYGGAVFLSEGYMFSLSGTGETQHTSPQVGVRKQNNLES
jgi:hypothetical protein